eukprot:4854303-Pyramimonas_sp.AAC.1
MSWAPPTPENKNTPRTHAYLWTDLLRLGLTHTQTYSYIDLLILRLTHTQTYSYPDLLILRPTHTQASSYPDVHIHRLTHTQTYPDSHSELLNTQQIVRMSQAGQGEPPGVFSRARSRP